MLFEFANRPAPPRETGMTCLIDNGLPTEFFCDVVSSHSALIDAVKFGWGTSVVTADIMKKVEALRKVPHIKYFLGGTLFEKSVQLNKVDEFVEFCRKLQCQVIEVSDGTLDLDRKDKIEYIGRFSGEFEVYSEVGYKSTERSLNLPPSKWVEFMRQELAAGATRVITESRESGTSGICRANGEVRFGLIEDVLSSGIDPNQILFEAPTKALQVYFLKRVGNHANLANISFNDVVSLETLRWGLRGDTFETFGFDLQPME